MFKETTIKLFEDLEGELREEFNNIARTEEINTERILAAFQSNRVAARHFTPSLGYGYDDNARDTLDRVFAEALFTEDALVRPHFVNGTHALFTALAGITEPGDVILSVTGKPYDTLEEAVGLRGDAPQSLKKYGIGFECCDFLENGSIDIATVDRLLSEKPEIRVVYLQRSRGYSWRNAVTVDEMATVFSAVKKRRPDAVIMVDNCYGEFTDVKEPTSVGADLIAGSLIKNPGGGLAPTGGYIAGRSDLVERVAQRLTVPGLGREVGSYSGDYRLFYQGLFTAPHCVAQCLKTAVLYAKLFEHLGYPTLPASDAKRSDVVQAVRFPDAEKMISFCQCIQGCSPVDSFVVPEPWDMPGYHDQVIMAAGTFVQGATSELSADGPVCPPYTAYMQGSLTYAQGKISAMRVYERLTQS